MTFFAFIPSGTKSSLEDRRRELNTALKAEHDNHLGNDDIMHLTTKTLFIPENIYHLELQITCYKATLGKMLGPKAWVLDLCTTISNHIDTYHTTYTEQFKLDTLFGAKFLFLMDTAFQDYFRSLMASDVHLSEISTYEVRNEITNTLSQAKKFSISSTILPSHIATTKAKAVTTSEKQGGGGGGGRHIQKTHKADTPTATTTFPSEIPEAVNDNINPAWTIPAGKDYLAVYRLRAQSPKGKNKEGKDMPFCLNFHTNGKCKRGVGCFLLHDDPRTVKPSKAAEYTAFLAKCFT